MPEPINVQPINQLAPWGVTTDDGEYIGVQQGGLYATRAVIDKIVFGDGTTQETANSGGFSNPDMGTF